MSTIKPQTSPPPTSHVLLSYPADYVLLVTINREKQMNSIPFAGHLEMGQVFDWFDREPNLRVAIITGAGKKSFCAGQDLIELGKMRSGEVKADPGLMRHPSSGFGGLSRRGGKKPVIAAVNGFALGGGFEIVLGWYVQDQASCQDGVYSNVCAAIWLWQLQAQHSASPKLCEVSSQAQAALHD
jgi:hypothetical protein